ncbi:MAG: 30S ribosomal protein THX [Taibaiella sp.]|nr:30S ribosomal protein THX [Taibaiella sp.]MBX9449359.1 30S ribosomal protein THX [Taibaiella sp.]
MGRGDKKSKKGKISIGSYGVARKKAENKRIGGKAEQATAEEPVKKPAAKKAKAAKKTEE